MANTRLKGRLNQMNKQLIVFCSNYRQELERLNLPAKYSGLQVAYFPSRCGMPPLAWSELKKSLAVDFSETELHVVSCGGIKGLPQEQLIADKHYNHKFKQCYHLITSPDLTDYYVQKGYYLVVPGWLAHWQEVLAQWGFDQDAAIEFFEESAKAILLLDTGVDPKAEANLAEFAAYVKRPFETLTVGLDYLELLLSNKVLKSNVEGSCSFEKEAVKDSRKELADFVMALDLLSSLAQVRQEDAVLDRIRDMFQMLFAPREFVFRPHVPDTQMITGEKSELKSNDGFIIPVSGSGGLLGEIEVKGLNQPQHLEQYKKLATRIISICGLAIENARHYQKIKDLSDTDGLTALANRRKLTEHLEHEWRRLQREKKPLALLMCDIDNFKNYNDYYGHQAGDDCLKAVAGELAKRCRRAGDLAARYGGEEFTMVFPDTTISGAQKLAEEIRLSVQQLAIEHEDSLTDDHVTISIGAASMVPSPESSVEMLLAKADKALYAAKEAGRNRVVVA
jgi:diguanylate cyclase (GGDEF)-like protein